jgi:hypothetical protein
MHTPSTQSVVSKPVLAENFKQEEIDALLRIALQSIFDASFIAKGDNETEMDAVLFENGIKDYADRATMLERLNHYLNRSWNRV